MNAPTAPPPAALSFLLAASCGLIVANLYYAQPLAGPIGAALGLSPGATGLIVTLTQIGYGAGLLALVPLGDLMENRKLVLGLIGLASLGLIGAAASVSPAMFLASALLLGLGSVAAQVLVPYAAHLAPDAIRGRVVGNVMSGLMLGIMLARPVASMVAEFSSWRVMFWLSVAAMAGLALILARALPPRTPSSTLRYRDLLLSMVGLLRSSAVLRRRSLYHACLFGAFSLFWTTVPLYLASPAYGLSQGGIALFALAGVAGAVATPLAGRIADRGWIRPATRAAMAIAAGSFLLAHCVPHTTLGLGLLTLAAIGVDFGSAANLTLGQRAIFALGAAQRARLNGLYMAIFFAGGAVGSALGGWAFAQGGWALASWIGTALPVLAFAYQMTEARG
ncbi:MAG: MFS transporter [Rhodospirillales bacterium]|nr:MFS transporter [Rhodospirillales bacterium]